MCDGDQVLSKVSDDCNESFSDDDVEREKLAIFDCYKSNFETKTLQKNWQQKMMVLENDF